MLKLEYREGERESEKRRIATWHQHLGYPQSSSLQLLKNKGLGKVLGVDKFKRLCDSFQLGKFHRLPFSCFEN